MTDATRQRDPESRAPQSRARPVAACRSTLRCSRTVVPGLLHFATSSLSVPRTSSAVETAAPAQRSQTGLHGQTSTQPGAARPHVCRGQKIVDQRGGHPSIACAAAARTRAWVSRNQFGAALCNWNIDSTVCCQTRVAHVYQLLVPDRRQPIGGDTPKQANPTTGVNHEQASSHLCPRVLGSPEGESHHRQPDGGADRVRAEERIQRAAGMGVPGRRL
jgi:hypothetical protein